MRETVMMLVPVRVEYDTPQAKRSILASVRSQLGVEISASTGEWVAYAKTGRPTIVKPLLGSR